MKNICMGLLAIPDDSEIVTISPIGYPAVIQVIPKPRPVWIRI
jgi:hypothetical protein